MLSHALIVIVITVAILLSDVWLMFLKNKVYIAIINRKKLENYDNNYNNNDGEEQCMKFMKLNYGLKQVLNIDDLHSKERY